MHFLQLKIIMSLCASMARLQLWSQVAEIQALTYHHEIGKTVKSGFGTLKDCSVMSNGKTLLYY